MTLKIFAKNEERALDFAKEILKDLNKNEQDFEIKIEKIAYCSFKAKITKK